MTIVAVDPEHERIRNSAGGSRTRVRPGLPRIVLNWAAGLYAGLRQFWLACRLAQFRRRVWRLGFGARVRVASYVVRVTDGPNAYVQYKDEFLNRIYDFVAARPDPRIIDGGSNIGMSVLYFKQQYPHARILGFEPDLAIFELLEENVRVNGLTDVQLIRSALGARDGEVEFSPDGSAGGQVLPGATGPRVRAARLSEYLAQPVDFLKLNIEGSEYDVLHEVEQAGRLQQIQEMVVEYHGWPAGPQRLGAILELLDRNRFRYLIHDFDAETCGTTKPPFRLSATAAWFCLIYARRDGAAGAEPPPGEAT